MKKMMQMSNRIKWLLRRMNIDSFFRHGNNTAESCFVLTRWFVASFLNPVDKMENHRKHWKLFRSR